MENIIINQFKTLDNKDKLALLLKINDSNFSNLKIGMIVLFVIHIPIFILDFVKHSQGLWQVNLGYKYIFLMHLTLYGFLILYSIIANFFHTKLTNLNTKEFFCYSAAFFLQVWCAIFSAIDQMLFGDTSIFIISLFCLTVLFKFKSSFEFVKLLFAEIVFLVAVPFFQAFPERTEGILINSVVAVILAFIASRISYSFKLRELASHTIILRQKEELSKEKEKVENATRDKNEFIASMSHEIQNQMNGVVGILKLLEITRLNEEQKEYINIVDSSVKNLLTIISDVLDFTRMQSGMTELETNTFDLPTLIKEILSISSSVASLNNNVVRSSIAPNVPTFISGDKIRLSQILLNLLGNAVKFTKSGVIDLNIILKEKKDFSIILEFEVKDTGVGIPSSRIPTIFEMYKTGEISSSRKYKGTGLGLAISKRLVEMMGGGIKVKSKEGEGTIFHFTIKTEENNPLQENKPDTVETEKINQKPETIIRNIPLKILLVDDNEINIKLGKKVFAKLGYEVKTAYDGKEAVEICQTDQFDIIFMDLRMPVLNGFEATELINKTKSKPTDKPIIIALTANANSEDREKCLRLGMIDFLLKPLDVSRIKDYIVHIANTYHLTH